LIHYNGANNTNRINRFTLHPQNERVLYYPNGGTKILQFDVLTGHCIRELSHYTPTKSNSYLSAAASADNGSVAAGSGKAAHTDRVLCVAYHPAHEELYSSALDRSLQCWTPSIWNRSVATSSTTPATLIEEDDDDDDADPRRRKEQAIRQSIASAMAFQHSPLASAASAHAFGPPSFVLHESARQ
jgi:hypothetical protein